MVTWTGGTTPRRCKWDKQYGRQRRLGGYDMRAFWKMVGKFVTSAAESYGSVYAKYNVPVVWP